MDGREPQSQEQKGTALKPAGRYPGLSCTLKIEPHEADGCKYCDDTGVCGHEHDGDELYHVECEHCAGTGNERCGAGDCGAVVARKITCGAEVYLCCSHIACLEMLLIDACADSHAAMRAR